MTSVHAAAPLIHRPGTRTSSESPECSENWMEVLLATMTAVVEEGGIPAPETGLLEGDGKPPMELSPDLEDFLFSEKEDFPDERGISLSLSGERMIPEEQPFPTVEKISTLPLLDREDTSVQTNGDDFSVTSDDSHTESVILPLVQSLEAPSLGSNTPLQMEKNPQISSLESHRLRVEKFSDIQSPPLPEEGDSFEIPLEESMINISPKSLQETSGRRGTLFIQAKNAQAEDPPKRLLQDALFRIHLADTQSAALEIPSDQGMWDNSPAEQILQNLPREWIYQGYSSGNKPAQEIRIQLHPEDLGAVDVQMVFDDQGRLEVVLSAEKETTRDLLQEGSQQLQEWLDQAGYDQTSFSFSSQDAPQEGVPDHRRRSAPIFSQGQVTDSPVDETSPLQPASQSLLGLMDVTL